MPSVNTTLQDLGIAHQISLQRFSNGMTKDLIKLLDKTDADIIQQLMKKSLKDIIESQKFNHRRIFELERRIRALNKRAHIKLNKNLQMNLFEVAHSETSFQKQSLMHTVPLEIDIASPSRHILESLVKNNPLHGKFLAKWTAELGAAKSERVLQQLKIGMVEGESIDDIVRRIRGTRALNYKDGVMEIGRRQTQAVVRTAVTDAAAKARELMYVDNDNLISKVRYVATLDGRTTPICRSLDGKRFDNGKGPRPPQHVNCRSTTVPVTKSWREMGIDQDEIAQTTRASMNGQVPAQMNYNSWLKTQSAGFQDSVLGRKKGILFRKGGLTMDSFINNQGKYLTLDQLKKIHPKSFLKIGIPKTPIKKKFVSKKNVQSEVTKVQDEVLRLERKRAEFLQLQTYKGKDIEAIKARAQFKSSMDEIPVEYKGLAQDEVPIGFGKQLKATHKSLSGEAKFKVSGVSDYAGYYLAHSPAILAHEPSFHASLIQLRTHYKGYGGIFSKTFMKELPKHEIGHMVDYHAGNLTRNGTLSKRFSKKINDALEKDFDAMPQNYIDEGRYYWQNDREKFAEAFQMLTNPDLINGHGFSIQMTLARKYYKNILKAVREILEIAVEENRARILGGLTI